MPRVPSGTSSTEDTPTETSTVHPPDDPDVAGEDREKAPDWYCPGCGLRYTYQQKCTGKPESPHPPIEVVSVSEIGTDHETAAPPTDSLG